jgi:hypothetical protein
MGSPFFRPGTYPATLYWHVGNRSQVLAAIVEHVLGEMIVRDALSCPGTGTTARSVEKEFNYAERAVVYSPSLASRSSALLLRREETALVWGHAVKLRHGRQPGPAKSPSEAWCGTARARPSRSARRPDGGKTPPQTPVSRSGEGRLVLELRSRPEAAALGCGRAASLRSYRLSRQQRCSTGRRRLDADGGDQSISCEQAFCPVTDGFL